MRNVWAEIAHTSGATAVTVAASLLSLTVTARVLGPAGRGVFVSATGWVTMFATLGTLSLGQVIVHQVAGRPPREWLGQVTGTAIAITAAVGLAGWLIIWALYQLSGGSLFGHVSPSLLALAFLSLPLLVWIDTARYITVALGAVRVANWAQIGGAVTALAGIGVLVAALRGGVPGAVAASIMANMAAAGSLLAYLVRRQSPAVPGWATSRRLLRGSAQLHLSAVGNYLFTQASVLVLNYYRPAAEAGYYQLAMQLFGLALLVSGAIGTVSFGIVAQKGPDAAWPEQRLLVLQSLAVVTAIAAVGYLLSPFAIRVVAGERFLPAVPLFRTVLPGLYGATFSTVMASQWVGRGLFAQAAALTIAVGVISLTLDMIFVPRLGMQGALVSTLVTYAISVVGNGAMAVWVQAQWKKQQCSDH